MQSTKVRPFIEEVARAQHERYLRKHRAEGVTTRMAPWGNDELMVEWEQLSERAKDYNRVAVIEVLEDVVTAAKVVKQIVETTTELT